MTSEPSASRSDPGKKLAQNTPSNRRVVVVISSDFPKKTEIISKIEACLGEVHVSERLLLSADQTSLLQLVLDAATWGNLLKVALGSFLVPYLKEAGKDAWKLTKEILGHLRDSPGNPISRLARVLARRKQENESVEIRLGLNLPGWHDDTVLRVESSDEQEIAQLIVEFSAAAPAIQKAVEEIIQLERRPLTGIHLSMSSDGQLTAFWHDGTGRRSLVIRYQAGVEKEHQPWLKSSG